jgi:hypothetical protein
MLGQEGAGGCSSRQRAVVNPCLDILHIAAEVIHGFVSSSQEPLTTGECGLQGSKNGNAVKDQQQ